MIKCFENEESGRVEAALIFRRSQLLYDIKNCCYVEGDVLRDEGGHHRHLVQDVGEEGNVDRMTRVLDKCVAKVRENLYAYTKHAIERPELDDILKERESYGILLSVPAGFSQTTLTLMERLIHEYLVSECVADWLSITHPDKMPVWKAKSEEALAELNACQAMRMHGVRRKMHPF